MFNRLLLKNLIIHAAVWLILFIPQRIFAQIDIFQQVDTAKKCSICHYRWVQTFYVEHRGTPLAPLNEKEVVGSQKMCLSCHDGSVRDSRDKICNDPGHRVGTIPSKRVTIPEKFPLDKNGALLCATCHTPHATTKTAEARVEFFLRAPNINSSFCRMCHTNKTGGVTRGNHPVDVLPMNDPSELIKAGGRLGTKPKNHIICRGTDGSPAAPPWPGPSRILRLRRAPAGVRLGRAPPGLRAECRAAAPPRRYSR